MDDHRGARSDDTRRWTHLFRRRGRQAVDTGLRSVLQVSQILSPRSGGLSDHPAHTQTSRFYMSDSGLEAEVWTKPKIGIAPTECVFGPRVCAREDSISIDKLVTNMEKSRAGNKIIKERSDQFESWMEEAVLRRVARSAWGRKLSLGRSP